MAATETLPRTKNEAPITTDSLLLPSLEPIAKIAESVSTQSVDIDFSNFVIQEVLPPSSEIELEIVAPSKRSVEEALGAMVGGELFLYELHKERHLQNYYYLKVTSDAMLFVLDKFAAKLQAKNRDFVIYINGSILNVGHDSAFAPAV